MASWELGLLQASDWQGKWITAPTLTTPNLQTASWIWSEDPPVAGSERFFRRHQLQRHPADEGDDCEQHNQPMNGREQHAPEARRLTGESQVRARPP